MSKPITAAEAQNRIQSQIRDLQRDIDHLNAKLPELRDKESQKRVSLVKGQALGGAKESELKKLMNELSAAKAELLDEEKLVEQEKELALKRLLVGAAGKNNAREVAKADKEVGSTEQEIKDLQAKIAAERQKQEAELKRGKKEINIKAAPADDRDALINAYVELQEQQDPEIVEAKEALKKTDPLNKYRPALEALGTLDAANANPNAGLNAFLNRDFARNGVKHESFAAAIAESKKPGAAGLNTDEVTAIEELSKLSASGKNPDEGLKNIRAAITKINHKAIKLENIPSPPVSGVNRGDGIVAQDFKDAMDKVAALGGVPLGANYKAEDLNRGYQLLMREIGEPNAAGQYDVKKITAPKGKPFSDVEKLMLEDLSDLGEGNNISDGLKSLKHKIAEVARTAGLASRQQIKFTSLEQSLKDNLEALGVGNLDNGVQALSSRIQGGINGNNISAAEATPNAGPLLDAINAINKLAKGKRSSPILAEQEDVDISDGVELFEANVAANVKGFVKREEADFKVRREVVLGIPALNPAPLADPYTVQQRAVLTALGNLDPNHDAAAGMETFKRLIAAAGRADITDAAINDPVPPALAHLAPVLDALRVLGLNDRVAGLAALAVAVGVNHNAQAAAFVPVVANVPALPALDGVAPLADPYTVQQRAVLTALGNLDPNHDAAAGMETFKRLIAAAGRADITDAAINDPVPPALAHLAPVLDALRVLGLNDRVAGLAALAVAVGVNHNAQAAAFVPVVANVPALPALDGVAPLADPYTVQQRAVLTALGNLDPNHDAAAGMETFKRLIAAAGRADITDAAINDPVPPALAHLAPVLDALRVLGLNDRVAGLAALAVAVGVNHNAQAAAFVPVVANVPALPALDGVAPLADPYTVQQRAVLTALGNLDPNHDAAAGMETFKRLIAAAGRADITDAAINDPVPPALAHLAPVLDALRVLGLNDRVAGLAALAVAVGVNHNAQAAAFVPVVANVPALPALDGVAPLADPYTVQQRAVLTALGNLDPNHDAAAGMETFKRLIAAAGRADITDAAINDPVPPALAHLAPVLDALRVLGLNDRVAGLAALAVAVGVNHNAQAAAFVPVVANVPALPALDGVAPLADPYTVQQRAVLTALGNLDPNHDAAAGMETFKRLIAAAGRADITDAAINDPVPPALAHLAPVLDALRVLGLNDRVAGLAALAVAVGVNHNAQAAAFVPVVANVPALPALDGVAPLADPYTVQQRAVLTALGNLDPNHDAAAGMETFKRLIAAAGRADITDAAINDPVPPALAHLAPVLDALRVLGLNDRVAGLAALAVAVGVNHNAQAAAFVPVVANVPALPALDGVAPLADPYTVQQRAVLTALGNLDPNHDAAAGMETFKRLIAAAGRADITDAAINDPVPPALAHLAPVLDALRVLGLNDRVAGLAALAVAVGVNHNAQAAAFVPVVANVPALPALDGVAPAPVAVGVGINPSHLKSAMDRVAVLGGVEDVGAGYGQADLNRGHDVLMTAVTRRGGVGGFITPEKGPLLDAINAINVLQGGVAVEVYPNAAPGVVMLPVGGGNATPTVDALQKAVDKLAELSGVTAGEASVENVKRGHAVFQALYDHSTPARAQATFYFEALNPKAKEVAIAIASLNPAFEALNRKPEGNDIVNGLALLQANVNNGVGIVAPIAAMGGVGAVNPKAAVMPVGDLEVAVTEAARGAAAILVAQKVTLQSAIDELGKLTNSAIVAGTAKNEDVQNGFAIFKAAYNAEAYDHDYASVQFKATAVAIARLTNGYANGVTPTADDINKGLMLLAANVPAVALQEVAPVGRITANQGGVNLSNAMALFEHNTHAVREFTPAVGGANVTVPAKLSTVGVDPLGAYLEAIDALKHLDVPVLFSGAAPIGKPDPYAVAPNARAALIELGKLDPANNDAVKGADYVKKVLEIENIANIDSIPDNHRLKHVRDALRLTRGVGNADDGLQAIEEVENRGLFAAYVAFVGPAPAPALSGADANRTYALVPNINNTTNALAALSRNGDVLVGAEFIKTVLAAEGIADINSIPDNHTNRQLLDARDALRTSSGIPNNADAGLAALNTAAPQDAFKPYEAPRTASAAEGIRILQDAAINAKHPDSDEEQLSRFLAPEKKTMLGINKSRRSPATDPDQIAALESLKAIGGGSVDRGLEILNRAVAGQNSSTSVDLDIGTQTPEMQKQEALVGQKKQALKKRVTDQGFIPEVSPLSGLELENVLANSSALMKLNKDLAALREKYEEKSKALQGKKDIIQEAVDKDPAVATARESLQEKELRYKALEAKAGSALGANPDIVKDESLKEIAREIARTEAILAEKAAIAEKAKELSDNLTEVASAEQREWIIQNKGGKAFGLVAAPIEAGVKEMVDLLAFQASEIFPDSENKGKAKISAEEDQFCVEFDVKAVLNEEDAKAIFGQNLDPKAGMGKFKEFVGALKDATAKSSQNPLPLEEAEKLKNFLEAGSSESQAFYQNVLQEVVWKQMTGEEKANIGRIYLRKGGDAAVTEADLPNPDSLQGIFYAVANKRGGFLERNLDEDGIAKIIDQIEREKHKGKSAAKTSGDDLSQEDANDVISRSFRGYLDRKKAGELYNGRLSEQEGRIKQLESELKTKGHVVPDPINASSFSNSGRLGSSDTSSSSYEARLAKLEASSQQNPPSLADLTGSLKGKTVADYSTEDLMDIIKAAVRETVASMQASNMAPMFYGAPAGNMHYAQGGYYAAPSPFMMGASGNMSSQMSPTVPMYPQGCPIQQPMLNYGGQSWVPYGTPFYGQSQQAFNGYGSQQFPGSSNGQASFQNIDQSALTEQTANKVFQALGKDNPMSGAKANSSAGALDSKSSTDFGVSDSSERSESASKRSALASSRGGIVNEADLKEYLSAPDGSRANSESNILLKEIRGSGKDGKFEILGSGIAVARYENYATFAKHVEKAAEKKFTDGTCESITGAESNTLVSIAKIKAGKGFSYQVVVSDPRGVRSHSISEKDYNKLVESDKSIAFPEAKLANKDNLMASIEKEFAMEDPENHKLSKEDQRRLVDQCSNEFYLPSSPFASGRKNTLKEMVKNASVTNSDRDEIVIERNRKDNSMVTVSINGEPKNSNGDPKSAYVGVGNNCFIKVKSDKGIVKDTVFKLEDDGSYKEVNIDSKFFGIGKGSTLAKELGDSEAAKSVIDRFYNTKIVVVKNKGLDQEGNETPESLQFLANGKTHGLQMSRLEKAIVYPVVTAAVLTASFFTGGAAAAGIGWAAVVAAGFTGTVAPATFGIIAGASTLGEDLSDEGKSTLNEAGDQVAGSIERFKEAVKRAYNEGSVSRGYRKLAGGAVKRMEESKARGIEFDESESKIAHFAEGVIAAPVKITSNSIGLGIGIASTPVVAAAGVIGWMAGNKPSNSPKEPKGGFKKYTSKLTNKQKVEAMDKALQESNEDGRI